VLPPEEQFMLFRKDTSNISDYTAKTFFKNLQ
jgi:hypothetical protein